MAAKRRTPNSQTINPRREPRRLSDEERALWEWVTRQTDPLPHHQSEKGLPVSIPEIRHSVSGDKTAARTPPQKHQGRSHALNQLNQGASSPGLRGGTSTQTRDAANISGFHRRELRRIARGHHPIEARLDLHGMRQAQAHAALRRFLYRCQAQGLRHVLVITGKGSERRSDHFSLYGEGERGVLRNLVPRWLAEPEFRHLVVAVSEARRHHGGEGALYIRLRRQR